MERLCGKGIYLLKKGAEISINLGQTRSIIKVGWSWVCGYRGDHIAWPVNSWPRDLDLKTLGLWFKYDVLEALSSVVALLTRGMGWFLEEVESLLVDVRKDIENRHVHANVPL
jgi:hypothetical protein